jgi:hypothetical protein
VPFVPHLRDSFRKHLTFMRQRNVHRMYIEKTDIVYVGLEELFSEEFPKRSVFKETLMQHKDLLQSLAAAGPAGFASFQNRVPVKPTKSGEHTNGPEQRHVTSPRWE